MTDLDQLANDFREMKLRNRTRNRYWEPFMRKYKCKYVCELGVCKGVNFYEMILHGPKLAVAIDSWKEDGTLSRNDRGYSQETLDSQYEAFAMSVRDKPFVKVYREYSFNAVKYFKDNYFDLIYVDADHSYEGCLRDLEDWYPKVKKGKFLLGDDYRIYEGRTKGINFGVIEATNEFAKKNKLELYMFPRGGWGLVKK